MSRNLTASAIVLASLLLGAQGGAQASQVSVANVSAGGKALVDVYGVNGASAQTGAFEQTYTTLDAGGNTVETVLKGEAFGQSSAGFLKASAQISLTDPVLAAGVPTWFTATGNASLQDTLRVANPLVTSIQFKVHIDGSLATEAQPTWQRSSAQGAFINLRQNNVDIYARSAYDGASFDDVVLTRPIAVTDGAAYLNIYLQAYVIVSTNLNGGAEGGHFAAESLFNNTSTLVEAYGFDSKGQQVSVGSLTGSGGFSYALAPVVAVPEPQAWLLLAGGLLLLPRQRRNV